MAYRTTAKLVQEVLLKDYDEANAPSLQGFIASANVLVTRVAACAIKKNATLSSAELELIERWLAAHFYATSDRPYQSKSTDKASASFVGQSGKGLESTYYGQAALDIDSSGCLENITKKNAVGLTWLGKPPSAQTDYVDRD